MLDDKHLMPPEAFGLTTDVVAAPNVVEAPPPAPVPSEAWTLQDPPSGAPTLISFVVTPVEQIRAWQSVTQWHYDNSLKVERQTAVAEAILPLATRSTVAAEKVAENSTANVTSLQTQAASSTKAAAAMEKLAADLAKPVAFTSADLAYSLLTALAPTMPNATETAVVDRVKALVARFRLFYPAASTPAPR